MFAYLPFLVSSIVDLSGVVAILFTGLISFYMIPVEMLNIFDLLRDNYEALYM